MKEETMYKISERVRYCLRILWNNTLGLFIDLAVCWRLVKKHPEKKEEFLKEADDTINTICTRFCLSLFALYWIWIIVTLILKGPT
jgi:uncharacterized membrane protein